MSKELTIKLNSRFNVDEQTKSNLQTFFAALKNIPSHLNLEIFLEDPKSGVIHDFDIANLVIEQVKNHFKINNRR